MFFRRILVSFGRRLSRLFIKRRFIVGLLASVVFLAYFKSFLQFAPSEVSLSTTERLSTNIVGYRPSISTTKQQTQNDSGTLNIHMWIEIGGTNVDFLRNWPHFPHIPDNRSFLTEFCKTQDLNLKNNGERIFGFVRPQKSGKYKFAITSDDTSELWLSPNEDPASSVMIARVYSPNSSAWTEQGDYKKYPEQISKEILLNAGKKYFIESLSKQGLGATHVAVYWSYGNLTFEIISSKYLSSFSEYNTDERIPTHAGKQESIELRRKSSSYYFNRLPVINREEYLSLIPSCAYTPSFLVNGTIQKHSGVWRTIESESRIFPRDDTNMFQNRKDGWSKPNALIDKNTVESIVGLLMNALRSRKYILKKIYKVIQKPDPANGDRFLLNLELGFENSNQTWRLSEHVYQKKNDTTLCLPEGMNWNNNVTVYFILPVKDQGRWVHYFLSQLADASLLTGDTNFHVIIVDFESKDIDLRKALNTPVFRSRHTVLSLTGKFYKTLALNKAAELVPNAHDIIFLFDLHIDVPADIMDSVRMNTIAGRMAYFPVVGRLDQASSSVEHRGYWEKYGYGIMSIYKSDWDKFGGMNIEAFKYNWGGEDWDLVDRVVSTSMEVERIRYPGLYHHYHPKRKLWN